MSDFIYFLRVIFTPACWIRNESTNWDWDREINFQLQNPIFTENGSHTCVLNGQTIWTSNYPYAYCIDDETGIKGMPSRITVFKFKDALDESGL